MLGRLLVIVALLLAVDVQAQDAGATSPPAPALGPVTKLPIPRYVSLRAHEVNVRRGPGLDYRIDWKFQRTGLPVKVVDEYGDWRRIVDRDNAGGWVYHPLITGRRMALVTTDKATLHTRPEDAARLIARAEQEAVLRVHACQAAWCEVEADGHRGWIRKGAIWGVDPDEIFGE